MMDDFDLSRFIDGVLSSPETSKYMEKIRIAKIWLEIDIEECWYTAWGRYNNSKRRAFMETYGPSS